MNILFTSDTVPTGFFEQFCSLAKEQRPLLSLDSSFPQPVPLCRIGSLQSGFLALVTLWPMAQA